MLWLEKQFKGFPADKSFQAAEAEGAPLPISPAEAIKALELLREDEEQAAGRVAQFNKLKAETDELINDLYEARKV